jgi:hypothetical protein
MMKGETNLRVLVKNMTPELNPGEYVFCTLDKSDEAGYADAIGWFREREGTTVILPREKADELDLAYSFIASWISLRVHSSLAAVGLTAVFSAALAEANISCNVVAAYYHDHIFVAVEDTEKALGALKHLSEND